MLSSQRELTADQPVTEVSQYSAQVSRAPHPCAAPARRSLMVAQEDGERRVALQAFVTHVGRGFGAHVRLDDHAVSRRHAVILADAATVTIHDDRSVNGTFVNGQRISESQLHDGDVIVLGHTTLRYLSGAQLPAGEPHGAAPALCG